AAKAETDRAALLQVQLDRQARERADLLHAEVEKMRYSDWQSHFIVTSEAGPLETFSPAFLEPKIQAAMVNPFAWPPGCSAAKYTSQFEALAVPNVVAHIGEGNTRFDKMLRDR